MSASQIKLGAIFIGWITTLFLLFVVAAATAITVVALGIDMVTLTQKISRSTILLINFSVVFAIFASFLAGGYVSGRMAAYSGAINGAMTVVTSIVATTLTITFVFIFTNKLGLEVSDSIMKTLSSSALGIFVVTAFAFMGSVIGGRFGEGYVDRLDLALGITKPTPTMPTVVRPVKTRENASRLQQKAPDETPQKSPEQPKQAQAKKKANITKKAG